MEFLQKKSTRIFLQILILVLVAGAIGLQIYSMLLYGASLNIAVSAVFIITLLCAALYCLFGFKKGARFFYIMFMLLYIAANGMAIITMRKNLNVDTMIVALLAFGCTCILAFATDMGFTKSIILACTNLLMCIIIMLKLLVNNAFAVLAIGDFAFIVLSIFLVLMVLAKYADKAMRGKE